MSTVAPPADRRVPGLGIAVNRDALLQMLTEHLPECRAGMRLLDARVFDVQYAPGSGARVLWKLNVQDPETGRTGRQLLFVRALRQGESVPAEPAELVRRYTEIRRRRGMSRELPLRTPWLHVPAAQVIVHAFPLDPALPTLLDAADPLRMKQALHQAWRARGATVRRVRPDILSYTPGARAALRYEVLAEDRRTGIPELRHLVGKVDGRRSPARLFAGHWAVWRRTLGRVSIAPPVGYIATSRLSLQEFVAGTRLSDLAGPGAFIGQVAEAARGIAVVHALTLPLLSYRGPDKEMRGVERWIDVLSRLRPAHAGRLEALGRRMREELAARMRVTATVHADFHLANALADDHGVTFIDWDQAAHGDPMVDIGRVLASLRVSSLRVHGSLDGFANVQEGFLRTYLAATGEDEGRARLFEAVSLLVAAAAPFRLQREGWEEGAELMLDEVERVFELSLAGPRVPGTDPDEKCEVPFTERADWAMDPPYAQALLLPIVHDTHGSDVEVTECVPLLRHRGRRRLHVRWELKGYRERERWRSVIDGVGFPDDSGRGRLHRLEIAAAVLAGHPDALQLPRPLGHMGPLSLVALAAPEGRPLVKALGTEAEAEALALVAGALARFHSLEIDLGRERATGRELRGVKRRIHHLARAGHGAAPAARELLDALAPTIAAIGERRAPTLRGLDFHNLRLTPSGAGVAVVDDVLNAEPLLDIAELCAQLRLHALHRGVAPVTAEALRRAYAAASGRDERELAAFEALAILGRACRRGLQKPADPRVEVLVSTASELIAAPG